MRFPKLKLFLAMLMLASPADADEDDVRRLRRVIEQGVVPTSHILGAPEVYRLAERMAHYHVPGLSLAVVDEGKIAFSEAYGDARKGEPVTPVTRFQAASLSKPVTAIAVMRLVEQGMLDLDADIRVYLKSWSLPEGAWNDDHPVTIRRILSHAAGFTVHGFAGYAPGDAAPAVVDILNGAAPANSAPIVVDLLPGTEWRYSGGGYTALQVLMEDVTGEPFPTLMKRLVLDPFEMTHSTFDQPFDQSTHAFAAHAHDGSGALRPTHRYPELAAAGLWTTSADLASLLANVMASYSGDGGVLTQASAQILSTPVTDGMGPGFAVDGQAGGVRLTHGGSNMGFKCFLAAWPERGRAVVMMSNADQGGALQRELFNTLGQHYGW